MNAFSKFACPLRSQSRLLEKRFGRNEPARALRKHVREQRRDAQILDSFLML